MAAKKEKPAGKSSAEKAEARKARNAELQNNYQVINNFDGVVTEALTIRNHGVVLRETSKTGISSVFIPDVKIKKKGVNFNLVKDTEEMREAKAEKRKEAKAKKTTKKK